MDFDVKVWSFRYCIANRGINALAHMPKLNAEILYSCGPFQMTQKHFHSQGQILNSQHERNKTF